MAPVTPIKSTSKPLAESPAEAIMASPPTKDMRAFYFNKTTKCMGYTPNKTNKVTLTAHEGHSHTRVSTVSEPRLIVTGNTLFSSPSKKVNFGLQSLVLFAQLTDLKNRSNTDYAVKKQNGCLSPSHLVAARRKIAECIAQLENCLKLKADSPAFLSEINLNIRHGKFFNPYGLRTIYSGNDFDLTLADNPSIYQAPIAGVGSSVVKPAPGASALAVGTMFLPRAVLVSKKRKFNADVTGDNAVTDTSAERNNEPIAKSATGSFMN